jgi:hypothetical protein
MTGTTPLNGNDCYETETFYRLSVKELCRTVDLVNEGLESTEGLDPVDYYSMGEKIDDHCENENPKGIKEDDLKNNRLKYCQEDFEGKKTDGLCKLQDNRKIEATTTGSKWECTDTSTTSLVTVTDWNTCYETKTLYRLAVKELCQEGHSKKVGVSFVASSIDDHCENENPTDITEDDLNKNRNYYCHSLENPPLQDSQKLCESSYQNIKYNPVTKQLTCDDGAQPTPTTYYNENCYTTSLTEDKAKDLCKEHHKATSSPTRAT